MNTDVYYFAYGSNMNSAQMQERIGSSTDLGKSKLENYGINFSKKSNDGTGKASISPQAGSTVEGVLFRISQEQKAKLDRNEGVATQHYEVIPVDVKLGDRTIRAITYVAHRSKIQQGLRPSQDYLNKIVDGASAHGISTEHINRIRQAAGEVIRSTQGGRPPVGSRDRTQAPSTGSTYYFSYGNDMKQPNLERRIQRVNKVGNAILNAHSFKFSKKGTDRSGKPNVHSERGKNVEGVLYEVSDSQFRTLKAAEERNGYSFQTKVVKVLDREYNAQVSVARTTEESLRATDEYRAGIVDAAISAGLSQGYIEQLLAT